jgi:hypothetical protein
VKFEIGKFYKTRGGRKAQIFMPDNGAGYMLGIVLQANGVWFSNQWRCDGTIYIDSDTQEDLMSEWEEPKKPRLMAPAIAFYDNHFVVSNGLYSSEMQARNELREMFRAWPAVPNEDGFYAISD